MKFERCYVDTPIAVIGNDFECADIDNPRGEIYGTAFVIYVERKNGARYIVDIPTKDKEQAERQVAKINARGSVPDDFLIEARPAYCSPAYQALDDLGYWKDLERKEEEFDYYHR